MSDIPTTTTTTPATRGNGVPITDTRENGIQDTTDSPIADTNTAFTGPSALGSGAGSSTSVNPGNTYTLWDQYSQFKSGALPRDLPASMSGDQLGSLPMTMTPQERLSLKQRLYQAGYYGTRAIYSHSVPTSGNWDTAESGDPDSPSDQDAWARALGAMSQRGTSLDQSIGMDMNNAKQIHEDAAVESYKIPNLIEMVKKLAGGEKGLLGRELQDSEIQQLMDATFDQNTKVKLTGAEVGADATNRALGKYNTMVDPTTGQTIELDPYVNGGGPDSTAIGFGKALARSYGVTVAQDFTRDAADPKYADAHGSGLGVRLAGDSTNLLALHEWAKHQQGEGGDSLFKDVEAIYEDPNSNEPTALELVMNDGASRPDLTVNNVQNDNPTLRFLQSVKRPGDFSAYNWDGEGSDRRGAFGISDGMWEAYRGRVGVDGDDKSIDAQNKVAGAIASDLYGKYQNWEDVAFAFRVSPQEAERRAAARKDGTYQDNQDFQTDDDFWARDALKRMGNVPDYVLGGTEGPQGADQFSSITDASGKQGSMGFDYQSALNSNDPRFAEDRLSHVFQNKYADEIDGNGLMTTILSLMSKYKWSPDRGEF